jgi:hypothetical protein
MMGSRMRIHGGLPGFYNWGALGVKSVSKKDLTRPVRLRSLETPIAHLYFQWDTTPRVSCFFGGTTTQGTAIVCRAFRAWGCGRDRGCCGPDKPGPPGRTNASVRTWAFPAQALSDSHLRTTSHTDLVGGGAEDFADFPGEALEGEGLLQESFLGFGGQRGGEGILGVAGEVEDFDAGTRGLELLD